MKTSKDVEKHVSKEQYYNLKKQIISIIIHEKKLGFFIRKVVLSENRYLNANALNTIPKCQYFEVADEK